MSLLGHHDDNKNLKIKEVDEEEIESEISYYVEKEVNGEMQVVRHMVPKNQVSLSHRSKSVVHTESAEDLGNTLKSINNVFEIQGEIITIDEQNVVQGKAVKQALQTGA